MRAGRLNVRSSRRSANRQEAAVRYESVNLEWVTPSQNINYGERNKKSVKTRRNHAHNPKVIQLNEEGIPICEYNSQTEAAEVNGIPRTRLCRAMKEGSKYKGYYWKFKE